MPPRPTTRADAVVLRAVGYGEADIIATVYARGLGKLSVLARGARRHKRRFGAALDLFTVSRMELRPKPQADLWTLAAAEARESFATIAGDVAAFAHASYAIEITRELCAAEQPDDDVFDLLVELYRELSVHGAMPVRLRAFELSLLRLIGLGPAISACAACATDVPPGEVTFDPGRGGILCAACASRTVSPLRTSLSADALAFLRRVQGAPSLAETGPASVSAEVNEELRRLLTSQVLHHIGRPLKSLEFIAKVNRW